MCPAGENVPIEATVAVPLLPGFLDRAPWEQAGEHEDRGPLSARLPPAHPGGCLGNEHLLGVEAQIQGIGKVGGAG